MDLSKTLSYNYLFRGLPEEALDRLSSFAELRSYNGGDQLVRQFESNSDLLILIEGNAISRTFNGETVARFGPGSVIGEVALLDGEKRSANVVSVGESKAIIIPSKAMWQLMESNTAIGYSILKNISTVLCRRLRSMNEYADSAANPIRMPESTRR